MTKHKSKKLIHKIAIAILSILIIVNIIGINVIIASSSAGIGASLIISNNGGNSGPDEPDDGPDEEEEEEEEENPDPEEQDEEETNSGNSSFIILVNNLINNLTNEEDINLDEEDASSTLIQITEQENIPISEQLILNSEENIKVLDFGIQEFEITDIDQGDRNIVQSQKKVERDIKIQIKNRQPTFSGRINTPYAYIFLKVFSEVIAQGYTQADAQGYWSWKVPVPLSIEDHELFITASTEKQEPSIDHYHAFAFEVINEEVIEISYEENISQTKKLEPIIIRNENKNLDEKELFPETIISTTKKISKIQKPTSEQIQKIQKNPQPDLNFKISKKSKKLSTQTLKLPIISKEENNVDFSFNLNNEIRNLSSHIIVRLRNAQNQLLQEKKINIQNTQITTIKDNFQINKNYPAGNYYLEAFLDGEEEVLLMRDNFQIQDKEEVSLLRLLKFNDQNKNLYYLFILFIILIFFILILIFEMITLNRIRHDIQ